MDGVRLRPATADDFEFFVDLHKQSLGPYIDQVWGWDDDDQRAYLERNIAPEHTQVIVVDGVDIGRLNVEDLDDEVLLGVIEITPDYQGRGIGAQLIQTLLDDAFARDKRVRLNVLQVNTRAYQLYRRLGFTEVIREGVTPKSASGCRHSHHDYPRQVRLIAETLREMPRATISRRWNPIAESSHADPAQQPMHLSIPYRLASSGCARK